MAAAAQATATGSHLERAWLAGLLEELCEFDRETGSRGERQAARWLADRLGEEGAVAEVEEEASHHTFWWPLGLACCAGTLARLAGWRGRRLGASALGLAVSARA